MAKIAGPEQFAGRANIASANLPGNMKAPERELARLNQALQDTGDSIISVTQQFREAEKEKMDADAELALAKLSADSEIALTEELQLMAENAAPGAPGFAQTFSDTFDERANEFVSMAPTPETQFRLSKGLYNLKSSLVRGAIGIEAQKRVENRLTTFGDNVDKRSNVLRADPSQFDAAMTAIDEDAANLKIPPEQVKLAKTRLALERYEIRMINDPVGAAKELASSLTTSPVDDGTEWKQRQRLLDSHLANLKASAEAEEKAKAPIFAQMTRDYNSGIIEASDAVRAGSVSFEVALAGMEEHLAEMRSMGLPDKDYDELKKSLREDLAVAKAERDIKDNPSGALQNLNESLGDAKPKGQGDVYAGLPGLIEPGNIDLSSRPLVDLEDGRQGTVRSSTFPLEDGRTVLLPTIVNGKEVGFDEAFAHYEKTGEHLGIFETEQHGEVASKTISKFQDTNVPRIEIDGGTQQKAIANIIYQKAVERDVDPDLAIAIAMVESKLGQLPSNPKSSASGVFHFIDSTWEAYGGTAEDRGDVNAQIERGIALTADNAAALKKRLGRPPSDSEVYLAHVFGPDKAYRLATSGEPAIAIVGAAALKANNLPADASARDVAIEIGGRVENVKSNIGTPQEVDNGDPALKHLPWKERVALAEKAKKLAEQSKIDDIRVKMSRLPSHERNRRLDEAEQEARQSGSREQLDSVEKMREESKKLDKALKDDPLGEGVRLGVVDALPVFDVSDPETYASRTAAADRASRHFGMNVPPLTGPEIDAVNNALDNSGTSEQMGIFQNLTVGFGAERSASVYKALNEKGFTDNAFVGGLLLEGRDDVARTVLEGRKILATDKNIVPNNQTGFREALEGELDGVYIGSPQQKAAVSNAVRAYYASLSEKSGETLGDMVDVDRLEEAVEAVTGGIIEYKPAFFGERSRFPAPEPGVTVDQFESWVEGLTETDIDLMGDIAALPSSTVLEQIKDGDAILRASGAGRWLVLTEDADGEFRPLLKSDGKPFFLQWKQKMEMATR